MEHWLPMAEPPKIQHVNSTTAAARRRNRFSSCLRFSGSQKKVLKEKEQRKDLSDDVQSETKGFKKKGTCPKSARPEEGVDMSSPISPARHPGVWDGEAGRLLQNGLHTMGHLIIQPMQQPSSAVWAETSPGKKSQIHLLWPSCSAKGTEIHGKSRKGHRKKRQHKPVK